MRHAGRFEIMLLNLSRKIKKHKVMKCINFEINFYSKFKITRIDFKMVSKTTCSKTNNNVLEEYLE